MVRAIKRRIRPRRFHALVEIRRDRRPPVVRVPRRLWATTGLRPARPKKHPLRTSLFLRLIGFILCVIVPYSTSKRFGFRLGHRMVASLSLTVGGVAVLCPRATHFIRYLVLVQPRETRPDMT